MHIVKIQRFKTIARSSSGGGVDSSSGSSSSGSSRQVVFLTKHVFTQNKDRICLHYHLYPTHYNIIHYRRPMHYIAYYLLYGYYIFGLHRKIYNRREACGAAPIFKCVRARYERFTYRAPKTYNVRAYQNYVRLCAFMLWRALITRGGCVLS